MATFDAPVGLEIRDLVIEYDAGGYPIRPIDGLDLAAPCGTLSLLLGPSGCGKTSVLSAMAGILSPARGTIRLGPVDITALTGSALSAYRREQVGIVFQAFNLVQSLSALDNVMVPLRAAGWTKAAAKGRAGELIERMGLGRVADRRPGTLSGGQQQRVALARAVAVDPPLVVADEPTAHLDYVQVEEVLRLLQELAAGGRVVIVATHDQRLLPLAHQVIELVPERDAAPPGPQRLELSAGEVVFRQGSRGDLVYVIEAGQIDIITERSDGSYERRAALGPGRYFGEIGALCRMPRSATAVAGTPAVVVGYDAREFQARLAMEPLIVPPYGTPSTTGNR